MDVRPGDAGCGVDEQVFHERGEAFQKSARRLFDKRHLDLCFFDDERHDHNDGRNGHFGIHVLEIKIKRHVFLVIGHVTSLFFYVRTQKNIGLHVNNKHNMPSTRRRGNKPSTPQRAHRLTPRRAHRLTPRRGKKSVRDNRSKKTCRACSKNKKRNSQRRKTMSRKLRGGEQFLAELTSTLNATKNDLLQSIFQRIQTLKNHQIPYTQDKCVHMINNVWFLLQSLYKFIQNEQKNNYYFLTEVNGKPGDNKMCDFMSCRNEAKCNEYKEKLSNLCPLIESINSADLLGKFAIQQLDYIKNHYTDTTFPIMDEQLFYTALNADRANLLQAEYNAGIKKQEDSNGAGAGAGAGAGTGESESESKGESGEAEQGRGKRRREETFNFSDKMDVQQ